MLSFMTFERSCNYGDIKTLKSNMPILPHIFWLLNNITRDYFLMLMYNILNNCKEKKSEKNLCQETVQNLNVLEYYF